MRVTLVSLVPAADTPAAHVDADVTRRGLAAALAARGHTVTVVQEHPTAARLDAHGATWVFVPPTAATRAARRLLGALGDPAPVVRAPADGVLPAVAASRPEVIHGFDLAFYPSVALLARLARRLDAALVLHFHGGAPATRPGYRALARHALAGAHAFCFTTRERGRGWVAAGNLPDDARIEEVFESSSDLLPLPVEEARRRAGLEGDPIYLHVGRLDPVKDPLTTLRGFARVRAARPGARLHLAWTDAPLLDAVRAAAGPGVTLLGRWPRARMAELYSGADVLLQASRREVCGYAVLEAMACGLVPVLSAIPPFVRLLGDVGATFPVGDPDALAAAALAVSPDRARVRARFDAALAFPRLAADVEAVYLRALARRDLTRRWPATAR